MLVRVLYFGVLRDLFHRDEDHVELPGPATVGTLLADLRRRDLASSPESPETGRLWPALAVALNHTYVQSDAPLKDGDEVALLPPVSGGHDQVLRAPLARVELVRAPIPMESLVAALKAGADGAVVTFDGIVRNHTRGRQTLFLDYQAYEAMALGQMQALAAEALTRFPIREVVLVHRLGRLEVGETSVFIAVASAHRPAAFDACRWLIDTLKKTVPIWKKEHFVDGAVWADGEPFPDEIALSGATL
jgi:MoaE-MoaD fusion protein